MRMLERGHSTGLFKESRNLFLAPSEAPQENFERHGTAQCGVLGEIHGPGRTPSEECFNGIISEGLPDKGGLASVLYHLL